MKIAVIDDEEQMQDILKEYISRFTQETGIKMEVVTFSSGESLLKNYQKIWDILMFDIDMPGINGMDTARKVRKMDEYVTVLFVTNMAQYAIEGYGINAVDYILKPVSYYEFSMKFHRAVAKAARGKEYAVMLETPEGMRRIRVNDIHYVEVMAHYIYVHTKGRDFKVRGNMREWEEELKSYGFSRVHKSYLVNLAAVESIRGKDLTVGGQTVQLSRSYRDEFMQDYMKFYRGE